MLMNITQRYVMRIVIGKHPDWKQPAVPELGGVTEKWGKHLLSKGGGEMAYQMLTKTFYSQTHNSCFIIIM